MLSWFYAFVPPLSFSWHVLSVFLPGDYSILSRLSLEAITLGLHNFMGQQSQITPLSLLHGILCSLYQNILDSTLNLFEGVVNYIPFSSWAQEQAWDFITFNYYKKWHSASRDGLSLINVYSLNEIDKPDIKTLAQSCPPRF